MRAISEVVSRITEATASVSAIRTRLTSLVTRDSTSPVIATTALPFSADPLRELLDPATMKP